MFLYRFIILYLLILYFFLVGNIPYGSSEAQLKEIFEVAGKVKNFRLILDSNGKQRGYGFCEYEDVPSATCAIRKLNNYELDGRRLRVSTADENDKETNELLAKQTGNIMGTSSTSTSTSNISYQPPQPQTTTIPPTNPMIGPTSTLLQQQTKLGMKNSVSKVHEMLDSMTDQSLQEVLGQMKNLITQNPEQAKQILTNNPPLAYALLIAQQRLELISPDVVNQIIIGQSIKPNIPLTTPTPTPLPYGGSQMMMQPSPYGYMQPPIHQSYYPTLNQPYQQQQQQQQPLLNLPQMDDSNRELIETLQKVISLTPEEVERFPPEERANIEQIRRMYGIS